YKVAGPSEAYIITGRRGKRSTDPVTGRSSIDNSGQKVVVGGGVFVVPFVQQRFTLDLSSRHIPVAVRGAVTLRGIKSNLEGVAIVKVGGSEDAIRAAAQRFLQQQDGIVGFTQEVLSGALRAIVGRMSVEDIIRDRAAFAGQVAEEAEASLSGQGLILDAFQIQDITTEGSYLEDLGRPEAARAKQEADIAEAIARRASEQARLKAAEEIAIAERTYYLKQAEIKAETEAASARANAAGPLAEAARQQEVLAEQEKVAERQAALTDRELDTKVRKPADAARYQAEQEAEARRIAQVKEAEADAERARLTGQGEKQHRSALADAVRIEGEAEAAAIAAKGAAEAEAMQKKADAFAQYGDAAVLQMLVEVLPHVVAKAAEPLSAIDKLTVISTDGAS
ncbi:MAG TPA: SPFH domain-containing protein, partial [Thermopolyspora sp.]